MSKRKRKPPRRTIERRRTSAARQQDQPDLIHEAAVALDDGEPLTLLAMVSALLAALDVRTHPFAQEPQLGLPSRDELVATFYRRSAGPSPLTSTSRAWPRPPRF